MRTKAVGREANLPRKLGRYEIMTKIASGGMASVYLGRTIFPKDFHRIVAIKLCHPHLNEDPKFRAMLLHEAQLVARIRHPNVVQTIDVGVENELYLVMDYVDGASLAELSRRAIEQGKKLPVEVIAAILLDTLRGLEAAHTATDARGAPLHVIHRDVSPQNLLVGRDGITRVADFGVAKAAQGNVVTTKTGEVKGKLSYISPEQLSTTDAVTPKADLFAVGIVAWELVEGERLFTGDTYADTVQRVLYVPIPPFESTQAKEYPAFIEAVESALVRDPKERVETAKALIERIEASGVPIASHAQVASYVEALLGEPSLNPEEMLETAIYEDARFAAASRRRRFALAATLCMLAVGLILGLRAIAREGEETILKNSTAESEAQPAVVGSIVNSAPKAAEPMDMDLSIEPLPGPETEDAASPTPGVHDTQSSDSSNTENALRPNRTTKKRIRNRPRRRPPKQDKKGNPLYDPETI